MFDKYKNNIVVLLNLDKTPLGETGCLSNFLGSLSISPAPTLTSQTFKVSTSSELYPDYFLYFS